MSVGEPRGEPQHGEQEQQQQQRNERHKPSDEQIPGRIEDLREHGVPQQAPANGAYRSSRVAFDGRGLGRKTALGDI